jgi:hypothetical protein
MYVTFMGFLGMKILHIFQFNGVNSWTIGARNMEGCVDNCYKHYWYFVRSAVH